MCIHVLIIYYRHRWTGRFEAHLWDKGTWNPTQRKKGKQGTYVVSKPSWLVKSASPSLPQILNVLDYSRSAFSSVCISTSFCSGKFILVSTSLSGWNQSQLICSRENWLTKKEESQLTFENICKCNRSLWWRRIRCKSIWFSCSQVLGNVNFHKFSGKDYCSLSDKKIIIFYVNFLFDTC